MVVVGLAIVGVIFLLIGSIFLKISLKYKPMQKLVAAYMRRIANFRVAKLFPQKLLEIQIRLINVADVFFSILVIVYGILLIIASFM